MISYGNKRVSLTGIIPVEAMSWRNESSVYDYCRQHTLISPQDQLNWLDKIETDPLIKMYGIDYYGEEVGVCGFTSINLINRSAEFSLYIKPEAQGKGLGKDALYCLIRHGFEAWGFNRIWGETFSKNPALDLFTSMGFKIEGKLKQTHFKKGVYLDSFMIAILRSEWDELCD